ncbi:restriction endonuclease [Paenibacillus polymyxa]|uniref:restriction endonuclease n=1 Tax=Paenibacillus polymyxa TaxID=1406 RepID=UPI0009B6928E|nr:restriction endonuclease [Paenibacillus polymyxa]WPQ59407.1 restriction endonuclease [Paenibacillus polymyxa]
MSSLCLFLGSSLLCKVILKGKESYIIAVQCSCWKRDVGNEIVLQLKAGTQVHSCCVAWMVTTSNFTRQLRRRGSLNIGGGTLVI